MIKKFNSRAAGDGGFTLIETVAALLIFSIVVLGVLPLLISSMRGALMSRTNNVAKNLVVDAMERARGLPYYVSYSADNKRVDVLDLFYPGTTPTYDNQTYSNGIFTTICTSTTLANPACPRSLARNYTLRIEARFVRPAGPADAETMQTVVPTRYQWNAVDGSDAPPSQIMDLAILAQWRAAGRNRSVRIRSLLGDRRFGDVKVRGISRIDYGIQINSLFNNGGERTQLIAKAGLAESRIDSRLVSTADQSVKAAELRLSEVTEDNTGVDLGMLQGAEAIYHAPPDVAPPAVGASAQNLVHEGLDPDTAVAGIDDTQARDVAVSVAGERPTARGTFRFMTGTDRIGMWLQNQADTTPFTPLQLFSDSLRRMFTVRAQGTRTVTGTTSAVTGALGAADRRVETAATMQFTDMRLLPVRFIPEDAAGRRSVLVVDDFTASINCRSTASPSSTATASWSAILRYWSADANGYRGVAINNTNAQAELETLRTSNPLVYRGTTPEQNVYLFDTGDRTGYFRSMSSSPGTTSIDGTGNATSASIEGAMSIATVPLDPSNRDSTLEVSMGKMSCTAVDKR